MHQQPAKKIRPVPPATLVGILLFLILTAFAGESQADRPGMAMVSPKRVLVAADEAAVNVQISNPEQHEAVYSLSLIALRVDEYGRASEPDHLNLQEKLAQSLINFEPRVTVPGHSNRAVPISISRPTDLPDGEYRSHLRITPHHDAGYQTPKTGRSGGAQIDFLVSVSIPILVRHGRTTVAITPERATLAPGAQAIRLELKRQGNRSASVTLKATILPGDGSTEIELPSTNLTIYSPNPSRFVQIPLPPLSPKSDPAMPPGTRVRFEVLDREQRPPKMLNSTTLPLLGEKQANKGRRPPLFAGPGHPAFVSSGAVL